ncbi:hypothetical protein DAEQUDRAFT_374645 [Daedalea quercina L-15889]|uniref:BTB domain-containing protein n=1 Tax=Daedalea quercina L-15889 TaxID=1314783 RepID=A0A165P743_9APHY|nr:hypothetical protein DAEQUDRAFT_374645 [Daedalea quercina L-15889]
MLIISELEGQSESQNVDNETGLLLLHVAEDPDTLDALLRFCYPTANPRFICIANIRPVMIAATKYQMEGMSSLLPEQLRSQCLTASSLRCCVRTGPRRCREVGRTTMPCHTHCGRLRLWTY